MKSQRQSLREDLEKLRQSSTEPSWACEMDRYAHTPNFDRYCQDKWANEAKREAEIKQLEDRIWEIGVQIDVVDEILAKAEAKKFPRTPRQYGRAPGEKDTYDRWASRADRIRRFLDD